MFRYEGYYWNPGWRFVHVWLHLLVLKSKKIRNDQELIQSDPISWPQNQREITKYINWHQFTKGTRDKPNEQLFPRQAVIQLPKYVTHIIGEPKYKYGQQEQVTVEPQQK